MKVRVAGLGLDELDRRRAAHVAGYPRSISGGQVLGGATGHGFLSGFLSRDRPLRLKRGTASSMRAIARREATMRRNLGIWFLIIVAVGTMVLGLPVAAQATTNVVPNPGFEQGGCGDTPIICDWKEHSGRMVQDTTTPHSGSAAMALDCGNTGCLGTGFGGETGPSAYSTCAAIDPGTHPASFWYSGAGEWDTVELYAVFYQTPDCTGTGSSAWFNDGGLGDYAWHQVTGQLTAPSGTQSAQFSLWVYAPCDDYCFPGAIFDDLDVEDAAGPDATPPETTITSGPSGTTGSSSATFVFVANEPATFECSLDTAPFAVCSSPASYIALAEGSHTFRVRSTDTAGNIDPTPAERSWTVQANTPPLARFTLSCLGLTCSFDGSSSADSDGSVAAYAWNFGDGSGGSGVTASHTYGLASSYTVTLTVTDDGDATASDSKAVNPISLSARGYKLSGLQKADLSWTGASGTSFDVYRNGVWIATVQTTFYKDNINKRGPASYTYKVCAPATDSCSNDATVSF
jgi:PKD repeat protein